MMLATLLLNAVLAVSLSAPAAVAGPTLARYQGGSVQVPFTPCTLGMWWDGLCNDACGARVCVFVGHCKLVCGSFVVFDLMWMEVSVDEDGKPPSRCAFGIADQKKGGPYTSKTYTPRCLDDYIVVVDLDWNADTPEIRSLSCVAR